MTTSHWSINPLLPSVCYYLSKVRLFALKIVIWTDFLHQLVVDAEEGDEDADDFEGLGTEPGGVGLGMFSEACLRRVVQAGFGLLGAVGLLVLHATVKGFDVLGVNGGLVRLVKLDFRLMERALLLLKDLKLHHLGGWHNADGDISEAGGVVTEVDSECAIDVIHDLSCHQQAELQGLDVKVEVSPAKDLLGLHGCFEWRLALGAVARLVQVLRLVLSPVIRVVEVVGGWFGLCWNLVHRGVYPGLLHVWLNSSWCLQPPSIGYTIREGLHHGPCCA